MQCRDAAAVPQIKYEFIELGNLGQVEKDTTCGELVRLRTVRAQLTPEQT
jgi:hypothetical protein